MTDSKKNWTDSCERPTEYYMDINDSTAFGRGSDGMERTVVLFTRMRRTAQGPPTIGLAVLQLLLNWKRLGVFTEQSQI